MRDPYLAPLLDVDEQALDRHHKPRVEVKQMKDCEARVGLNCPVK
jgi:hypothetical protein